MSLLLLPIHVFIGNLAFIALAKPILLGSSVGRELSGTLMDRLARLLKVFQVDIGLVSLRITLQDILRPWYPALTLISGRPYRWQGVIDTALVPPLLGIFPILGHI